MAETYGVSGIPSDQTTVRQANAVAVSAAFDTTGGLVGSMDSTDTDATASTGDVVTIQTSDDADTAFGEDSELAQQARHALLNGASTVYAVAAPETTMTESVTASQSGTLSNVPIFDPRVTTKTVTVTDTSAGADVTVNYVDTTPSQPTESNTVNLNPTTGEWAADASSDYDFDYTYGDYDTAIQAVAAETPRIVGVCTENNAVATTLLTELNTYDTNFGFMHGVVGESPALDPSTYTNTYDDRRLAVLARSRGFVDEARSEQARTVGAVVGKQAGLPLGDSSTAESLSGFTGLYQPNGAYTVDDLETLIDKGVYPIRNAGGITIVKDTTTSTQSRFSRIAWSEITDEATELSHEISEDFVGDAMTGPVGENNISVLAESHRTTYSEMQSDGLLTDYTVSASKVSDTEVKLTIGIDLVGYMDNITVNISVGNVVRNEGAT